MVSPGRPTIKVPWMVARSRQGFQPGGEPRVAAGRGQHVHPRGGQGPRGSLHRAQTPSAAHEQDAACVRRYPQRRPCGGPRRRVSERGPHRGRDHGHPGPGRVAVHARDPGGGGHQEQVDALADPRRVGQGVGAEDDRARPRPEARRARRPGGGRLAETTSDTTSWPRPREPERITARFGTGPHLPVSVTGSSPQAFASLAPGRWPYPGPVPGKRPRAAQARFARCLAGNLTRVPHPTGTRPCPAGTAA